MDFTISPICYIAIRISYVNFIFIASEYSSFFVDDTANSPFDSCSPYSKMTFFMRILFPDFAKIPHELLKFHSVFRIKGKTCAEVI